MDHPLEALIHLPALARRLARVRQAAGAAKVWATVEADACGHGIERCYPALRGADGFSVFTLDEAQRLRTLGWRGPVWLRAGAMGPRDLELCSRWSLWHTVHCEAQIDWLAMHKTQQPHRVFLPLRVRAGALGFSPQAFRSAWARLNALPQVDEITLLRAAAPGEDAADVEADAEIASVLAAAWDDLPGERCLDRRSASALAAAAAPAADWILGGDALYGASGGPADLDVEGGADLATMTLRSRLLAVQRVDAGDAASRWIGVVACGQADGYPAVAAGLPVRVDGVRTLTVGPAQRLTLTVDLDPLVSAGREPLAGSEVTLWGRGPQGTHLPVADVARAAGCGVGALLSAVSARVAARCDPDLAADGSVS